MKNIKKQLNKTQKELIIKHKKIYSSNHIDKMIELMLNGETFNNSHKRVMKKYGK